MRIVPEKKTLPLTPESVDTVSADVQAFLTQLKAQKKNVLAARLSLEEILLDLMEHYGTGHTFTYVKSNFLGKPSITLSVTGEQFNPLEKDEDDDFGNWSSSLIQSAESTPAYTYDRGVNTVTMRFSPKELNPIIKMSFAIIAAFLLSLLRFVLPATTISMLQSDVLTPLYNAFLGLMTTIEIPLVFLSVACGIIGIGDSKVFGKIGRKMVLRFLVIILFFTSIAGIIFSMLFLRLQSSASAGLSLKVGIEMLMDLIPDNLIAPITSGNTMQVVLMAVFIGAAVVILDSKTKTVAKIVNEGNSIIVFVTSVICKLLPFFIFVVLLHMIWGGNIGIFVNMWKPIAAFIIVVALLLVVMLITVSAREKVPARVLFRKMVPTFLIGFGTASSVAANGECSDSLARLLGVNRRFVDFGQPVGGVIFMPATAINFMVCAVYMAAYYKVSVSLLWFIIAILLCSFVAVATPPVPGGAIAAYTIIFAQLGIPSEAVAIVVALDFVFDFVATAGDGAFLQLELIRQADENKMLNYDVLRSTKK